MDDKCQKCGQTLRRLVLLAMLQDAGAHVFPSSYQCAEGGEHEFQPAQSAAQTTEEA